MIDIPPHTEASLATVGHIYCAGTLTQCVYRWNRLTEEKKASAFLKIRFIKASPTILRREELSTLAESLLEADRAKR